MLPPRPSFLPARPEGALEPAQPPASLVPLHDPTLQAGPSRLSKSSSSSNSTICAMCPQPSKYTCPGCSTRTCSVVCSKAHKPQMGCDGKRDPTKFVTLNTFSQGDWGGDYAYLEDGRRKIAEWGKSLPPSSLGMPDSGRGGRGRGGYQSSRGGGNQGYGGRKRVAPKVEGLRRQLETMGMDVEFMPEGMGRRKLNQSGWNPKTQSLHMTIQLAVPPYLLDPSASQTTNSADSTDPKIITHTRVLISTNQSQPLPTLASLLPSPLDNINQPDPNTGSRIIAALAFHPSLSNPTPIEILLRKPRPRLFFPPLSLSEPLAQVFRGMSFVEFPTVHIWSKDDWETALRDGSVAVVPPAVVDQRGTKRKSDDEIPVTQSGIGSVVNDEAQDRDLTTTTAVNQVETGTDLTKEEVKKPRLAPTGTDRTGGTGLLTLGGYASDSDDQIDEDEDEEEMGGDMAMEEADEVTVTEEDVQMMRVLGAAAAADME